MQNERMERAISGSRSSNGNHYAVGKPTYSQANGRDKTGQKRGTPSHSNFHYHKNAKAASADEPAARNA